MSGDNKKSDTAFTRRNYLRVLGSATIVAAGAAQAASAEGHAYGKSGYGNGPYGGEKSENKPGNEEDSDSGNEDEGGSGAGFGWNQTFTDTSWLTDADANDNLNVETVTTLDPGASGGIEDAVSASGPTVVVFEVGGVIDMDGGDVEPSSETWIAGETAPDPGISIVRGSLVPRSDRVIASHLGIYAGDGAGGVDSAIEPRGDDLVFDHCSAYWGVDEVVGMSPEQHRVSIINTVIAEGLDDSVHSEGPHSRGYLVNDENCTGLCTMGSIFASNNRRQPWAKSEHVLVNNLVFNHCSSPNEDGNTIKADNDLTAVGIQFKPSDETDMGEGVFQNSGSVYYDDIETGGHEISDGDPSFLDTPPLVPEGLSLENDPVPASELEDWMRTNCGMRPAARPGAEQDFFQNRLNDTFAGTIDSQDDVGGYPDYDSTTRALEVPSSGIVEWVYGYKAAVEVST